MYFGGTELFVVPLLLLVWELREARCDLKLQGSRWESQMQKVVVIASGKEKGFQDSPDVPLCGLPIGFLDCFIFFLSFIFLFCFTCLNLFY